MTAAVAAVTAVVLAVTGVLVFQEFTRGLDDRTDAELRERAQSVVELAEEVPRSALLGVSGESLAQVFSPDGVPTDSTRRLDGSALLAPEQVRAVGSGPVLSTRARVAGTDDGARVIAFRLEGGVVVALGEDRDLREAERLRLGTLLLIGLPTALLLAAFTGYQVAGAALRPVERIRSRAAQIGQSDLTERLPQPGTGDELDRLTTTLNDLLGRLAEALVHERRIVSDASHELRTPISVLRTRLDVALRGPQDAEALRAVVREAQADTRRLARLADDLLVLARADQGRLPLRPEPLDVQDLLEATAERHRADADAGSRTIVVRVEIEGGAVVLADPDRLAQALDNLVVNALRHGRGAIEIVARRPTPATVAISVADRGPGFGEDLLPRAFDRFSQGREHKGEGGAGLGLAIVDALLRASGGDAQATDRAGGGAEVTITLPAA